MYYLPLLVTVFVVLLVFALRYQAWLDRTGGRDE